MVVRHTTNRVCLVSVERERVGRVGLMYTIPLLSRGAMGVRFQSNKPFISLYAVRLLLFLDVQSMFNRNPAIRSVGQNPKKK